MALRGLVDGEKGVNGSDGCHGGRGGFWQRQHEQTEARHFLGLAVVRDDHSIGSTGGKRW